MRNIVARKRIPTFGLLLVFLAGSVHFVSPMARAFSMDAQVYASTIQKSDTRKAHLTRVVSDFASLAGAYKKNTWKTLVSQTDTDYKTVLSDFDVIRNELASQSASQKILDRLDAQKTAYQNTAGKIVTDAKAGKDVSAAVAAFTKKPAILAEILNATPFRAVQSSGKIHTASESAFPGVQSAASSLKNALNAGTIKLEKTGGLVSDDTSVSFSATATEESVPTSGSGIQIASVYTDETEETTFTQAIRDLAAQLNYDPLEILNYVSANIRYVPYYGSKKGADATLAEREGNDLDQISLLAALLRVGDTGGNQKTQVKYRQAFIKLDVGRVMDFVGVEDPLVAAEIFEKTGVPYILYVDQNNNPLFFMIEHFYAEVYVNYDYLKGIARTTTGGQDRWIPLDPTLGRAYFSQPVDAVGAMQWNVGTFYDNYLAGNYGTSTPLDALKQDVQTYLSANDPSRIYDDALAKQYRDVRPFEFIPQTLPYELVSSLPEFSAVPQNLKHRIEFKVMDDAKTQTFMVYTPNVVAIADKELAVDYVAATPADQSVIDSFPSIYDIVPLSLVHVKPVVKVRGVVVGGGQTADPDVALGVVQRLSMVFKVPTREIGSSIVEKTIDTQEKTLTAGGAEGIAINTDHIALPETRPAQDMSSSDFAASQKLYATALHFLYRLQSSHDELAAVMGGEFTNSATRAVVFNGIDITYSGGVPYSFTWKGLRIDASSLVNYWSHFGTDVNRHQKEFLEVFGLQASLDEARIFEDDYGIEGMSTVKGLRMINQGQIPGVSMRKITSANISTIDALSISSATKTKLKDAVRLGHTIYVPTAQFTYQNWTGLVYIDLDPITGAGGYIIGEGLNGGYTAGTFLGDIARFLREKLVDNISATVVQPTSGQQFTKGSKIHWKIQYSGTLRWVPAIPVGWTEEGDLDTSSYDVGTLRLTPGYGVGTSVAVTIIPDPGNFPTPVNPTQQEFIDMMGINTEYRDIIRAIAWQEFASSICDSDANHYAHYCNDQKFITSNQVIFNASNDWGVMQINQYWFKDIFNNPKTHSGDHIGWDWTVRDWRENIKDAVTIFTDRYNEETEAQQLWSVGDRLFLAAYGYHMGGGRMKNVTDPSYLRSFYYTGDGLGGNPIGVIYYYRNHPWAP